MEELKSRDKRHYVYAYMDPRKPVASEHLGFSFTHEVFYVGKGTGHRYKHHLRDAKNKDDSTFKLNKIRSILSAGLEPIIEIIQFYETDEEAFAAEEALIESIGRAIEGGPLTNICEGGIGAKSGESNPMFGRNHTDEAREKMSRISIERYQTKPHPLKGKKASVEQVERMREVKCTRIYHIISPTGEEFVVTNLRKFCREHPGLHQSLLGKALKEGKSHKGWTGTNEERYKESDSE